MTIDMDPEPVRQAGDDLTQVASTAEVRIKRLLGTSAEAAAGNPGWGSAEALRELRQAWERHVDEVVERTLRTAQALRDAAGLVTASDREAADRMSRVLRDLEQC